MFDSLTTQQMETLKDLLTWIDTETYSWSCRGLKSALKAEIKARQPHYTLCEFAGMTKERLNAMGLTDQMIAALDVRTQEIERDSEYDPASDYWRSLPGMIARNKERAHGVTMVDVAATLGYMPEYC